MRWIFGCKLCISMASIWRKQILHLKTAWVFRNESVSDFISITFQRVEIVYRASDDNGLQSYRCQISERFLVGGELNKTFLPRNCMVTARTTWIWQWEGIGRCIVMEVRGGLHWWLKWWAPEKNHGENVHSVAIGAEKYVMCSVLQYMR